QSGASKHRPCDAAVDRQIEREHANLRRAVDEYFVVNENVVELFQLWLDIRQKLSATFFKAYGQVIEQSAYPHVIVEQPRSARPFEQAQDVLAIAHHPEKRRKRADVHTIGAYGN